MKPGFAARVGVLLFGGALFLGGCGPTDQDNDGFSIEEDCNDENAAIHPGAQELCNGIDEDCNGIADEPFDLDRDGASICNGLVDCDESDPTAFPGNDEIEDGVDNDCDGIIDNNTAAFDDDGDCACELDAGCLGSTNSACAQVVGGDCADDDPFSLPGAIEVVGDELDNDCNGTIDIPVPCDGGALSNSPADFAKAIGLCHNEVLSAQFIGPSDARARAIIDGFGTGGISPFEGAKMIHFSSGLADENLHSPGTNLATANTTAHPDQRPDPGDGCGQADPATVNDFTEYRLQIKVPGNAKSFSYQFQFFSAEYPRFRCSEFDDTFLALLESQEFTGNISFDANGKVVSLNSGFFQICEDDTANQPPNICPIGPNPTLNGTGYDPNDPDNTNGDGGATQVLKTSTSVIPGETITLRFIIFDEGVGQTANFGHILDSSVLIDNFIWSTDEVGGPNTEIP